ncbi:LON peptidase substrate-binding domain-containing protein [Mycobacterium asiaticum]|uniref:LON peptidase substrate-binding domain-containing protein n=1 Tax=Mycobacterium asiaticum TaxID=1790 RepID=UPI000568D190|nr:LON peptidase substrate-binding domain-containing protein [Mycobacterium asiaticum]ORA16719.1 ATP-dependent protease [Mycobacterium asiaticum DSM 44297]
MVIDREPVEMAMFPLESVLLPGEDLPLRIFEPRYTALVRDCLDRPEPRFGVVLISRGREVGGADARCDVAAVARIDEYVDAGAGRYVLSCRMGERIQVVEWLPDDPYPRARVRAWPDEPGPPVTAAQFRDIEDRVLTLFERIAAVRDVELPERDVLLNYPDEATDDIGKLLYALATRVPMGPADKYAVLSAASPADRLVALLEAVDSVAAMIEFQLSE